MHKGTLNQELAELLNMNRRFFTYRSEIASGIKLNCKIRVGIYFLSRFMQICAVMHVWALVKQPIENHSMLITFWVRLPHRILTHLFHRNPSRRRNFHVYCSHNLSFPYLMLKHYRKWRSIARVEETMHLKLWIKCDN